MSKATRYAISVALVLCCLVAAIGTSFGLAEVAIYRSQHQWCDTLRILASAPVAKPADPGKNPSRENDYRLYEDFLKVKSQFGC